MLAIDTNLVVRYLTNDHPLQSAQARDLIDREDVYVSKTVLLETEWVLRAAYGFDVPSMASAIRAFAGHPRVSLEDAELTTQALDWMESGLDFADALHVGTARHCGAFVSFDKHLVKTARRLGIVGVREP